jgi:hypothetical protein
MTGQEERSDVPPSISEIQQIGYQGTGCVKKGGKHKLLVT